MKKNKKLRYCDRFFDNFYKLHPVDIYVQNRDKQKKKIDTPYCHYFMI